MIKHLLFLLIICIFSCGSVIDDLRVVGTWKLDKVEFYVKNNDLDSVKTYTGEKNDSPSDNHPCESEFFGEQVSANYNITFDKDKHFKVEKSNSDTITYIDFTDGKWAISTYDNSLTIKVYHNTTASGFWKESFSFSNSWPMPNYQTLELTIKAQDVGKGYFHIDLANKKLKVTSMKCTFIKQD